ncbi:Multidrug resistance efflux pump PmrA [Streptococcus sp. DD13]|nr:Multidrug resistance efflux pump PmrA [Streptococcus sp. DD13]
MLFLASLLTVVCIQEDFTPVPKEKTLSTRELLHRVKDPQVLIGLFVSSMVIQISAQSVAPILTLYIEYLGQTENLLMISGTIVSAMGISSMLSSAVLGKFGDRIGNHRLILIALSYCTLIYLLMALAKDPIQLGILRFLFGFGTGSLMPSVSALLTKITPKEGISTIFGYNLTFINLGQVIGPFVGSTVAATLGYQWVFYVTSAIVFFNLLWSLVNFRKYLKVREIE